MKLTVITTWKNEEFIAPFFIRHYLENGADSIIVNLDQSSTDRTRKIAAAYPQVTINPVSFPGPWRASIKTRKMREQYDAVKDGWVILADADEFVFSYAGTLKEDIARVAQLGYDVISSDLWHPYRNVADSDLDVSSPVPVVFQRCYGTRHNRYSATKFGNIYNKPIIARAGRRVYWSPGQHCIGGGHRMYHTSFPGAHWKFADPAIILGGRTPLNVSLNTADVLRQCEEHKHDERIFGGYMPKSNMQNQGTRLQEFFEYRANRQIHKWPHYFPIYEKHFSPYLGRPITMLEIGVQNGGSLDMWRDYFGSNVKLVGLDVDPRCQVLADHGYNIIIGSQADPEVIRQLVTDYGPFDIILDDGSHCADLTLTTFHALFPYVAVGGIYMIEDTHTAYWPAYGGGVDKPGTSVGLTKTMIDAVNAYHSRDLKLRPDTFTETIGGIHSYDSIVVFDRSHRTKVSPPEIKGKTIIIPGTDHACAAALPNPTQVVVDVVMPVCSSTPELREMTQRAIDSLHASSAGIRFNVIVLESHVAKASAVITNPRPTGRNRFHICKIDSQNCVLVNGVSYKVSASLGPIGTILNIVETPDSILANRFGSEVLIARKDSFLSLSSLLPFAPTAYRGCTVLRGPQPFNYNQYMNIGISKGSAEYVVMCNNDVIFHPGWMDKILTTGHDSMSPWSPRHPEQAEFVGKVCEGYRVRRELSGWCIVTKRSMLSRIGKLDEDFWFYSADRVYAIQLRLAGGKHYIVGTSVVEHLQAVTTYSMTDDAWIHSQIQAAHKKIEEKYPGLNNG